MFNKAKQNFGDMTDKAEDMKNQAKQSGQDWMDYVIEPQYGVLWRYNQ